MRPLLAGEGIGEVTIIIFSCYTRYHPKNGLSFFEKFFIIIKVEIYEQIQIAKTFNGKRTTGEEIKTSHR